MEQKYLHYPVLQIFTFLWKNKLGFAREIFIMN
jgi:hypothetical protein